MDETTQGMDSVQEQPIQVEIIDEVTPQVEPEVVPQQEPQVPTTTPETYTIDGESYTAEQLREMKQGYMRQQDYTRKTQELARMRQQPQVSQPTMPMQPGQIDPVMQRIDSLEQHFANQQLDMQITMLKTKYPDFDETKVLNEAYERGVTDLEFIYKATKEIKEPNMAELEQQIRAKVMAEIEATKASTSTIISNTINTPQPRTVKITRAEANIAQAMGLTPEEYVKWK